MNSLLTSIAGQFAKPLLLSALLPVLVVTSLFLLVTYPLFPVPLSLPAAVEKLDPSWQIAASTVLALVAAMLLYILNTPIARLFSGYPWKDVPPGSWLARLRRSQFRRLKSRRDGLMTIVKSLDAVDEDVVRNRLLDALTPLARRLNEDFPYREDLMLPTKLGNVIRNFEDYSREQYGISTVTLWPRLVAVIDSRYATGIDDAKMGFDFALNCTALFASAAILTLVLALSADASGAWLAAAALRTALFGGFAALAYAAAVNRARGWGSYVKAAVDLYRGALLKQMSYQYTLESIADERARIWTGLASEWNFPDMAASLAAVPFAAPPALPAPATSVRSENVEILTVARGITAPAGRPFAVLTVTLRVDNTSPTVARIVTVTDAVPPNWSLVWASPAGTAASGPPALKASSPVVLEVRELPARSSCHLFYQLQSLVATP